MKFICLFCQINRACTPIWYIFVFTSYIVGCFVVCLFLSSIGWFSQMIYPFLSTVSCTYQLDKSLESVSCKQEHYFQPRAYQGEDGKLATAAAEIR